LFLEGTPLQYPICSLDFSTPQFLLSHSEILNTTKAVMNIPVHYSYNVFLQTYHEKPILDGYPSRAYLNSFKVINLLDTYLSNNETEKYIGLLSSLGVKYIIVNWDGNIDIPETSHLHILTNPKKFYESSLSTLELVYNSSKTSIFKIC
jgi:hypothetical protein